MATRVSLDFDISEALPKLQQLMQALQAAKAEAQQLGQALATGGGTDVQRGAFRQSLQQVQGLQAAVGTIQNSITNSAAVSGREVLANANIAAGVGLTGVPTSMLNTNLVLTAANLGVNAATAAQAIGSGVSLTQAGGAIGTSQIVQQIMQGAILGPNGQLYTQPAPIPPNMIGAFSPLSGRYAPGGYGMMPIPQGAANAAALAEEQANAGISNRLGRAAMYGTLVSGVVDSANTYLSYSTQRVIQGGDDVMSRYGLLGRIGGTIIGGALGAAGGPWGIAFGAAGGGSVGENLLRYAVAPEQARQNANLAIAPFLGATQGMGGMGWQSYFTAPMHSAVTQTGFGGFQRAASFSRFEMMTNLINSAVTPEMRTSVGDVGATFGTIASGLFAGGQDPLGQGESIHGAIRPYYNSFGTTADQNLRLGFNAFNRGGLIEGLVQQATAVGKMVPYRYDMDETLGETYTRRLGLLFGKTSTDVAKNIQPIFGTLPETGGNVADILSRFGPEATSTYLRIQNEELVGAVTPEQLRRSSAAQRELGRQAQLSALRPIGSAEWVASAFQGQMQEIAQLPGGAGSLAYANAYAGFRSARFASYGQQDIGVGGANGFEPGFAMRDVALQGYQQRLQYMPFAPGNIFGASLGIIQNNMQQIGVLSARLQTPDLSEQERFSLFSQQQGLMTENARNVGLLSEGFENRLPGLAAGRPSFFGRYTSLQGAALNLAGMGSPIRAFGAANGAQAGMQDAFVNAFNVPGTSMPYSTTAGLNTTNEILSRILNAIERGNSGGGRGASTRPSDLFEKLAGGLDQIVAVERTLISMYHPGKN